MPEILLIQPPIEDFYLTAKRTIPYGLACLAGALMEKGFTVEIFDALATKKSKTRNWPPEMRYLEKYYGRADVSPFALFHRYRHYGYSFAHIGKIVEVSDAFLIGISSLFTAYQDEALKTAETVKKWFPNAQVVLGGHHPTFFPQKVMASKAVDYILRGEGEDSLPLLAKALKHGHRLDTIPGIVFRTKKGGVHVNPPAMKKDLNQSPLPALQLIKHAFYQRNQHGSMVVAASRGCPLKCSYCSLGAHSAIKYRRRSVVSVMDEIEDAVTRYGVGFIDFEDENLALEKEWFLHLLAEIRRRFTDRSLELRAMNGLLPTSLDDETIGAMKAAGFKTLNLSLGSTSGAQLKRFNRPDVRNRFEIALELAESYALAAVGYVIASAPGQRAETTLNDLLYLASRRVLVGLSIFYPSPGSADFNLCDRLELLPDHFPLFRSSCLPISHGTSRTEAVTLLRLARILNFMKSMVDGGISIPDSRLFDCKSKLDPGDRRETGMRLLSWFLNDGIIRGVHPNGVVYDHLTDRRLTDMFLDKIGRINIRGSV